MDDIIVPGATFEENIQRLKHTRDRLLSAALKLKPSNKGNNKITELRTILQRESQN